MKILGLVVLTFLCTLLVKQAACYSEIHPISKSNLLTTIPHWGREWRVSFEIKPLSTVSGWGSIVHFTEGGFCCKVGQRIPAVWFNPRTFRLHITTGLNNVGSYPHNERRALPRNKFSKVVIDQIEVRQSVYRYRIFVNGRCVRSVVNTKPRVFKNVKVYAGDPWNSAANAVLRNFKFTVEPEFTGNVLKGKLLRTIPKWGKEWRLSFKIKPIAKQRGWSNILHLSARSNAGRLGDRIPAIWLYPNSLKMSVYSSVGNNNNYGYTTPRNLPTTRFTQVRIEQLKASSGRFVYKIIINGRVVRSVTNTRPMDYRNVKVYTSDPWYPHANVHLRDLHLEAVCGRYFYPSL